MFFLVRNIVKRKHILARAFSLEVKDQPGVEKWDLFAGVSLERLPIISRDYNKHEVKYANILAQVELENSHKSKFEIRLENDLKRVKELKDFIGISDIDSAPQQTAQDFLDACYEEFKHFKFADRKEQDKIEKNVKSMRRALDRRLLLVIKEQIGNKEHWVLPQGLYQGEDSLRLTAERVLKEKCGNNIQTIFLGNCPCGIYKYKYPKTIRNGSVGAKIFFFKAQFVKGQVDEKICENFQWAVRNELSMLPNKYYKTIRKFLLDEEQ